MATSPFVTGLQAAAAKHALAVHVGIHVPVPVQAASAAAGRHPLLPTVPRAGAGERGPEEEGGENDPAAATTTTKLYNRTIWIDERGAIAEPASYDKLHLFDYATLRESANTQAGAAFTPPFASPVGRLGSLIVSNFRCSFMPISAHIPSDVLSLRFVSSVLA